MQAIAKDVDWLTVIDPDSPRWLVDLQRETIDAYRAGDLGWVLEHTHPDSRETRRSVPPARDTRARPGTRAAGLSRWLYRLQDGPTRRWEMFMSREAALRAARSS